MNLHIHDPSGLNLSSLVEMWVKSTRAAGHQHMFWPQWVDLWVISIFLMWKNIMSPPAPPYSVASSPDVFFRISCPILLWSGRTASPRAFILLSVRSSPSTTCVFSQLSNKHWSQVLYFYLFFTHFYTSWRSVLQSSSMNLLLHPISLDETCQVTVLLNKNLCVP